MKPQGLRRYVTPLTLSALVLAGAAFIAWDRQRATTDELEARRQNVFRAFHRERVDHIEVTRASGRYELRKQGDDWYVVSGSGRRLADAIEAERLLSEVEGAEAQRSLGRLDGASRQRFGLDSPRARVVVYEGNEVTARFAIGGAVEREEAVYVEASASTGGRDDEARAVVLPRSFAQPFDRAAVELRDRKVADIDPERLTRLSVTVDGSARVLERRGPVWRLTTPDLGRASRSAVEAITAELRELRATRVLADEADAATLARYGLDNPRVRIELARTSGAEAVALRFGNACPDHDDEFAATREGSGTVVCFGRGFVDALRVAPEGFRDDHVLSARTDEVSEVRVRGAGTGGADLVLRRTSGDVAWRADNSPYAVDTESIESWLTTLHDVSTSQRLAGDARAAHGLSPAQATLEVTRTGVEGVERILVGAADATGLYVSRDDEPTVLQFPATVADTMRVEAIRFRPRAVVHEAEDDLRALMLDAAPLHEELARVDGTLRVTRPVDLLADPTLATELARSLASLDAERWVSATPRPEHGLATPRARVVARYEGPGARDESDGGAQDATARVRSYTLTFGATAPGGGVYASLEGGGVFVAPRSFFDALTTPHADRGALRVVRDNVTVLAVTVSGAAGHRVELRRTGSEWRTATGSPVEATRVDALLDRLASVAAPRVFGYGPAPAESGLAAPMMTLELRGEGDAGQQALRITVGARFGAGEGAGFYARREGIDATLSLPESVVEALRDFQP